MGFLQGGKGRQWREDERERERDKVREKRAEANETSKRARKIEDAESGSGEEKSVEGEHQNETKRECGGHLRASK